MRRDDARGPADPEDALESQDSSERLRQLGTFLRSRRERLTPADVGLPAGTRRRVGGLRRDEVAALAGIGSAWYTQVEQGRGGRPSAAALDGLARALRMTDGERTHLFRLARVVDGAPTAVSASVHPSETLAPASRRLVDTLPLPAFLMDRMWDIAARNALLEALFPDIADLPITEHNALRYAFSPAWRAAVEGWERHARLAVAAYRAAAAEAADDPRVSALVAELTTAVPEFGAWWADQHVWREAHAPSQVYARTRAGRLVFDITLLELRDASGLTLALYTPHDDATLKRVRRLTAQ